MQGCSPFQTIFVFLSYHNFTCDYLTVARLVIDLQITMDTAVQTTDLTKIYEKPGAWSLRSKQKPVTAVDSVSLSVEKGELFGLLGPNGAGKTSLVKMLCTLILPSHGQATVAGYDLSAEYNIRALTGLVVSDERSFFWRLSVQKNLDFFAAMQGLYGLESRERITAVLKDVDLSDRADETFSSLSSGMRQRLAIARALLHQPQILFLDEPTRSLDPIATQRMHDLITRLREQNEITIFLITHDLTEAEKLCDRVALMHKAKIRKVGQPDDLRQHLRPIRDYNLICDQLKPFQLTELQKGVPSLQLAESDSLKGSDNLRFKASEEDGSLMDVLEFLHNQNIQIRSIEGAPPTLEEVFAHYTREMDEK